MEKTIFTVFATVFATLLIIIIFIDYQDDKKFIREQRYKIEKLEIENRGLKLDSDFIRLKLRVLEYKTKGA